MEVNNSGFWDIAYRDNAPVLLGTLRRYVKDVGIAQDLLHEVFITAIDKYDDYTGKGSFEGWLYRIAVNTALMYLRNERNSLVEMRQNTLLPFWVMDDDDTDDPPMDDARATIEAEGFSGEELLAAIDRLPEHHKLVFNMYVMDDFSHKQIAAELNISSGTSKSHLARARKKIQQFLYDDALNRKKIRDRRRASALMLLFPAKEHYIDRLYRKGLSNFRLPPTGDTEFLNSKIQNFQDSKIPKLQNSNVESWNHGIMESLNHGTTFLGSKLSYIAACCGTAAITGTACWLTMSVNSPLDSDHDRTNANRDRVPFSDTIMYLPNPTNTDNTAFDVADHPSDSVTPEIDDPEESSLQRHTTEMEPINSDVASSAEKATDPVVVTKQIIQHQTVVVRDTIYIVE